MFRLNKQLIRRTFATKSNSAAASTSKPTSGGGLGNLIGADQTLAMNKIYHKSHYVVLGLTPLALLAHPSALSLPVDVALSVVLPLHAHIGMNWIFTDYVPGGPMGPARLALLGVSIVTVFGLLRLSIGGPGIVGTVKELWTHAEADERKKSEIH